MPVKVLYAPPRWELSCIELIRLLFSFSTMNILFFLTSLIGDSISTATVAFFVFSLQFLLRYSWNTLHCGFLSFAINLYFLCGCNFTIVYLVVILLYHNLLGIQLHCICYLNLGTFTFLSSEIFGKYYLEDCIYTVVSRTPDG